MDLIMQFIDILLHVDVYIGELFKNYGPWVYIILFVVIFCETGLVVTPFLPGDSLLFTLGALNNSMDLRMAYILLIGAAILGNTSNYFIGKFIGNKLKRIKFKKIRLINKDHLEKTHNFFEKHGGKAIILSRFLPIIRTFAPFVAGISKMSLPRYTLFNAIGGILWVTTFFLMGYFFRNIPAVKENFTLVIMGIVTVTFLPAVITFVKGRMSKKQSMK
ncbi:MAG TPA: DedA family protein [Pseudobacteroides sp.]|nr:DedA family protein [Pseudobacteroides sp.]